MKRTDYDKLSRLVLDRAGWQRERTEYFSPWDQQVESIAACVGKPDEGRALVQRIKDDYAEAAAAHPEFEGKTVTLNQNGFYDGVLT